MVSQNLPYVNIFEDSHMALFKHGLCILETITDILQLIVNSVEFFTFADESCSFTRDHIFVTVVTVRLIVEPFYNLVP
jgi:hypothetical protein